MIHAAADVRAAFTPRMFGERLAVDDRAHLEADTRAADHDPQHDRRERGDDEHGDLVGVQDDPADLVVVVRGRADAGNRHALRDRVVALEAEVEHVVADRHDEPLDQRGQRDEETDGAHDAGVHRGLGQPSQEDAVEQQPEQRGEDEDRDDQRGHDRHTESGVQLVVEVRGRERDRAVREVEDARRGVGQHETRRHDPVDRAGDQAGERQVPELVHGVDCPSVEVASPPGSTPPEWSVSPR